MLSTRGPLATAQSTTQARRLSVDETVVAADDQGYRVIVAEFPFDGVGASWPGTHGYGYAIEFSFSNDGASFTAPIVARPAEEFLGQATRDGRVFTQIVFTGRSRYIRIRALDASEKRSSLSGLEIVYIDARAGPHATGEVVSADVLSLEKPAVVSRAGWGADESYRFNIWGDEIFPAAYRTVEHVIVHHTETLNDQDPYVALRIIYYYHAIELGWGDIGYNYLVGQNGLIFEGRYGGENVIGHHSYEYAEGSSGITCIGTYESLPISSATRNSLTAIVSWVARNLDPLGSSDFHSSTDLSTICGHRNVGDTTCPGDSLYAELTSLRTSVARVLADASKPPDGGGVTAFTSGDNVVFTGETMLRTQPESGAPVLRRVRARTEAAVQRPTRTADGREWYAVRLISAEYGYVLGKYLAPAPLGNPPAPALEIDDRIVATVNPLRLRRFPGVAQDAPFVTDGSSVARVTDGPVAATGQQWYRILTSLRTEGWVMQSELKLARARKVTVSLASGPANKLVTVTLKGFPVKSSVELIVGGVPAATISTDSFGGWIGQTRIPHLAYGKHTVRAKRGYATAATSYTVTPRLGISPAAGKTGSSVTAYLTGYPAGQTAVVQARLGTSWTDLAGGSVDTTGRAKIAFAAPATEVGPLALRATGGATTATASFTITASTAAVTPSATPDPTPTSPPTATAEPTVGAPPVETLTPETPAEPTPVSSPVPTETPAPEPTPETTAEPTPEPAPTTPVESPPETTPESSG